MEFAAYYSLGFYYNHLKIDQKYIYQTVVSAIAIYEQTVEIRVLNIDEIHNVLLAIKYDNPELFYWSMDKTTVKSNTIYLSYHTQSKEEAQKLISMIRKERKHILDNLQLKTDEINQKDALKAIYDYLTKNISYAEVEVQKQLSEYWIYDITGVFLKRRAVCLGIAMAVNYLCRPLHISSILITGQAKVAGWKCNHGWNLIELNDKYFHLDATCALGENEETRMKYFLVKGCDLPDHNWSQRVYPQAG